MKTANRFKPLATAGALSAKAILANLLEHLSGNVCQLFANPSEQSRSAMAEEQDQRGHRYAAAIRVSEANALMKHVHLKLPQ